MVLAPRVPERALGCLNFSTLCLVGNLRRRAEGVVVLDVELVRPTPLQSSLSYELSMSVRSAT